MPWGPEPLVTHLPVPSLVKITQVGKVWWAPSIHAWFSAVVVSRRSTADAYGLFWRCRVLVLSWHQAGQLGMPQADTFPRSLQQHEQRCERESPGSDQAIKSLRVAISCSCAQSPPRELCCRWDSFRKCSCHRNPSLIAAGGIVTELWGRWGVLWGSREGSKQGEEQKEPGSHPVLQAAQSRLQMARLGLHSCPLWRADAPRREAPEPAASPSFVSTTVRLRRPGLRGQYRTSGPHISVYRSLVQSDVHGT